MKSISDSGNFRSKSASATVPAELDGVEANPNFERPIKGDIDRVLSTLMHESRHKQMEEQGRIVTEAAARGMLQNNRVIVLAADAADKIHGAAMKEATPMLRDFVERMGVEPTVIAGWARPHLENLNNSVLGVIRPNGFPVDHQRIIAQYRAVFQQRIDGLLRDVEIGFVRGAGFSGRAKMPEEEEWISAARALALLAGIMNPEMAAQAICGRAHDGLIKARAERFVRDSHTFDKFDVPAEFWWARGKAALTQNWTTGDFETWINQLIHLKTYGVTFQRSHVEKLVPNLPNEETATPIANVSGSGGRPKADWWEDLWIDICRQLYVGDLQPKKQADIEKAMSQWVTNHNKTAAESTIRGRAQKLWRVIRDQAEK